MKNPKFTPGPWKVYVDPRAWNEVALQRGIPRGNQPPPEVRVGTEWDHPQLKGPAPIITTTHSPYYVEPVSINIKMEDAHLIAACPDLYKACTDAALWFRILVNSTGACGCVGTKHEPEHVCKYHLSLFALEAALAKADGEVTT